jgi:methionyl-tRNA formyltransferase
MKIILFAGGLAGEVALNKLLHSHGDSLAGVVWDDGTGDRPKVEKIPFLNEEKSSNYGDTLFCSGYGKLIGKELLESFPHGAFNAHPSLLPNYRGRHAIQWAIASGEKELGVTVHRMTTILDKGDYLLVRRRRFGISSKLTEISRELAIMAADMLVELGNLIKTQNLPEPVCSASGDGRYWPKRKPEDGKLDWQNKTLSLINTVRAGNSNYPAYANLPDHKKICFLDYLAGDTPGEVLLSTPEGCLVAVGDGVIWLVPDHTLKKGDLLE